MKIIDNCGCDNWVLAFAKTLFERNNIPCEEAYIEDMDDKWITIRAEVRSDKAEDGDDAWEEKEFTIKYWVDRKILFTSLLSVWFYDRKEVERENFAGEPYTTDEAVDIEKGTYCVTRLLGLNICNKIK